MRTSRLIRIASGLGGTVALLTFSENISRASGATHGQGLQRDDFATVVEPLGRPLGQRNTVYRVDASA